MLEDVIVGTKTNIKYQEVLLARTKHKLYDSMMRKEQVLRTITLIKKVKEIQEHERRNNADPAIRSR